MYRFLNIFRNHRQVVLFLSDLLLWNLSYYLSFAIRNNNFSLSGEGTLFFTGLLLLNISFSAVFLLFRLYDKLWRYADTEDFFYAAIASLSANLVFMTGMMITGAVNPALAVHSGIFITNALMSTLFVMLFRIIYRLNKILERRNLARKAKKRLMIIGLQTNYCIDCTVKSAFERGFEVIIPEGTNSTFDNDYMTGETAVRYYNEDVWEELVESVTFEEAIAMLEK